MKIIIPELSLVTLIGASGSGKSTFARQHFLPTEVISSDACRGIVSDDETNQAATQDAFDVLHYIAGKRLNRGQLTVIDATNTQPADRQHLLRLAKEHHCLPVAIVLNLPEEICRDRNLNRSDRQFGQHVIKRHVQNIRRSLKGLQREGFRQVYILNSLEQITAVEISREPLWNNKKHEHGPFDIIGDVHGCCDELETLLATLGYQLKEQTYIHPEGRKAVFLGDLVDRGDRILDTLNLVQKMVATDNAICVPGNHDYKLLRHLKGQKVTVNHGLDKTLAELESLDETELLSLKTFLYNLVSHYVLDDGRLVVAHAGMKQAYQGRGSAKIRDFAMYGESNGEIDEFGLPVRLNWASEYRGDAMVVYGHTPVPEPVWLNGTIDVDTGCVFGGKLTALRYPERELVSVPARKVYCEPIKPLIPASTLTIQQQDDDVLDIADVTGKRRISTKLQPNITIKAENAIAALEVMSRFAADPKWLIYLPPTMSPVETSQAPGYLEHPAEAFAYYQKQGIDRVICEQKHMGSRAIVIVCKSPAAAETRFGVTDGRFGICYTRTGRPFFDDLQIETEFLDRIRATLIDFWDEFQTDWICLDCELMPWSVKAQQLLRQQYAPVGRAAKVSLGNAISVLERAQARGIDVPLAHYQDRSQLVHQYTTAYRHYCWKVESISDFKLAPFHLLATEGAVHTDKSHLWHLEQIAKFAQLDPELILATAHHTVDTNDAESVATGIDWWLSITQTGGEGMVVKPIEYIPSKRSIQPAIKCRGQEYLRIIYGAEYSLPEHLDRLRQRGLSGKRSLALREFALGIESLDRFVAKEPLRRVHECTFGVLSLESEPIDPRL
jgi:protein phosphatase